MSIRLPMQQVLDVTLTDVGGSSVAGGVALPFKIPQDTDNVLVKLSASVVGAGVSAVFQTSDDGGTTYYDVARTSIVSNSGATAMSPQLAQWLSIPTTASTADSLRASVVAVGSVITTGGSGTAAASTLGQGQYSGLPIMGLQNRVFVIYTGNISAAGNSTRVQVMVNQQSATA